MKPSVDALEVSTIKNICFYQNSDNIFFDLNLEPQNTFLIVLYVLKSIFFFLFNAHVGATYVKTKFKTLNNKKQPLFAITTRRTIVGCTSRRRRRRCERTKMKIKL